MVHDIPLLYVQHFTSSGCVKYIGVGSFSSMASRMRRFTPGQKNRRFNTKCFELRKIFIPGLLMLYFFSILNLLASSLPASGPPDRQYSVAQSGLTCRCLHESSKFFTVVIAYLEVAPPIFCQKRGRTRKLHACVLDLAWGAVVQE